MTELIKRFIMDEQGQGLTEYALIIALVAVALIAVIITFRTQIATVFTNLVTAISGAS